MNKWRLLLFSIFALLHITTSDRSFIDGRYGCCNHLPRYLPSDSTVSTYERNHVNHYFPETRQLDSLKKNPNSEVRNAEIAQLSRRRGLESREENSRDNEIRRTLGRQRIRISTNPREEILRRQNSREQIHERNSVLRTDLQDRFARQRDRDYQRDVRATSLPHNNYRESYVTRIRFGNRDVSRRNNNNRDMPIRNNRENRIETRIVLSEYDERNTQRYINRNNIGNGFDYVKYTEARVLPKKSILVSVVREEPEARISKTRSERINIINRLENDRRDIRFGTRRNIYEDFSRKSPRIDFVRNNVRSHDRIEFKENKGRFIRETQINRRSAVRNIENLNSLIEIQKRSLRVDNRVAVSKHIQQKELSALRETSKTLRDCNDRVLIDRRQNSDRIEVNSGRENRLSSKRSSSEETYTLKVVRNDARINFERRNVNSNVRDNREKIERATRQRMSSEKVSRIRDNRMNIEHGRNIENMNSRQYMERNKREALVINLANNNDIRDKHENRLNAQRNILERVLERANKKTTVRNILEDIRIRDESSRSNRIQRNTKETSNSMTRRSREATNLTPTIRDDSRRSFRESQYIRSNEIRDRLNIQRDQNRMTSRINRNMMILRSGIQISRDNIENDYRLRSRSLSNDERLISRRQDSRNTRDERRQLIKNTRKERTINMRRETSLINERRFSRKELSDNERHVTHKIQYENSVFEMKWQYLFYALQAVYLCGIFMKISMDKDDNKNKRITDWLKPARYLKID